jgi:AraC family transcriptional regulator, transcriptional activator of pobA
MQNNQLNIEAEVIRSAFTTTEYVIRGARSYLVILHAGQCTLIEGEDEMIIAAPALVWTPVGISARLSISPGSRGVVLRIPETILGLSIPAGSISGYIRQAIRKVIVLHSVPPSLIQRMSRLFDDIRGELYENDPAAQEIVQHSLSLMLIHFWRASKPAIHGAVLLPRQIVHEFLGLVELHMQSHWTIERYSKYLGVSKDRLNTATRRSVGMSPNQYIQQRLMSEVKTLLLNSDLSVSEIAFKLGFADAAYFNRFFQRHENIPPGRFRTRGVQQDGQKIRGSEFAAWP